MCHPVCHLSGNWARVAIDTYSRYTERFPQRPLLQLSAPGLPVYSSSPNARDENLAEFVRLGRSARALGATHAMIACNTMHLLREKFEADSGLRMLDMVEATRQQLPSFRKVGIVATKMSIHHGLYESAKGEWDLVLPTDFEQDELQRIIEDSKKDISPKPNLRLMTILDALVDRGAEALVLGCTDFPQLLQQGWRPEAVLIDPIDHLIELAGNQTSSRVL